MKQVTVHKAKTTLSKLISEAEKGAEIVICRGHAPVAVIAPFKGHVRKRPKVGHITSAPVRIKPGCFDPLTDAEMEDWGMA